VLHPQSLSVESKESVDLGVPVPARTPYLILDIGRVVASYHRLKSALPIDRVHYALKCNPAPDVMRAIADAGGSFDVSSLAELRSVAEIGADTRDVLFSHPVKRPADIAAAHAAEVAAFAFDSSDEVDKIARYAPGSSVYVRLSAPPAASKVPSEGTFGVGVEAAVTLLQRAAAAGLDPCGLGFHVGSQMVDVRAWPHAISMAGEVVRRAAAVGIDLRMLDIGGGFPVRYEEPVPDIEEIAKQIEDALDDVPGDLRVLAEPGRYLAAEAGELVATVIGVSDMAGRRRVTIDAGVFHGLAEALETDGRLPFPVTDSRRDPQKVTCKLVGPTCDSMDVVRVSVSLSAGLRAGDTIRIHCAGAYTWSCIKDFNGFSMPSLHLGEVSGWEC